MEFNIRPKVRGFRIGAPNGMDDIIISFNQLVQRSF
jgi:hypothetical protein